ncbi:DNA-binding response regulator [Rhodococcus sp. 14-2483-1-1]|uniref:response regulator n=1 Tax=Rhodococcus sp. 14-2483-1-1 TaxID=2023148 RepID=UPI000B9C657B|nr:response regulator transcription factor [Rhodococcus sp. 14-2483-1-1]OZF35450.1 DNA-binding response regulator [Rhodococcus sp. 14-2483-1-1]
MTISVVLVDDQNLVRAGLKLVLGSRAKVRIVGEAADGREGVDVVRATNPNVVLMDVRMPVMDGIEATRAIVQATNSKVLILTTFDLDEYVFDALRAGAGGFLVKDAPIDELISAIQHVHEGDSVVAPSTTRRLIEHFTSAPAPRARQVRTSAEQLADLTPREREVLVHLSSGLSNAEIAIAIAVSEVTVKAHVGRILSKLGVRDRTQAVIAAYESGLVGPGTGG